MHLVRLPLIVLLAVALWVSPGAGQAPATQARTPPATPAALPPGYVIGADDILSITFWKETEMSKDVVVRPDGKISLPLLNDVQAAGLTPDELREQLSKLAEKHIKEPNASVVVKEIHSRKVFITGNVMKPGTYPLTTEMNVLQLIALAGGLQEWADAKNIVVMRVDKGKQTSHKFNYKDVVKQKNLEQNISLKSGDTVVVP
jgi:polysaccharide biosynthesis/export protein